MSYKSKALISERGRLDITFAIYLKNHSRPFIESGSAQSVNIRKNLNATINDCLLNAFYKLQHRRGFPIAKSNSEGMGEVIDKYLDDFQIVEYNIYYAETQARSFKSKRRNGKIVVEVSKGNKVIKTESRESLTMEKAQSYKDLVFDVREETNIKQRIKERRVKVKKVRK